MDDNKFDGAGLGLSNTFDGRELPEPDRNGDIRRLWRVQDKTVLQDDRGGV